MQRGGRAHQAEGKSGWDKAAVVVQAIGAFAIFVSLAGLFIGVRQFNEQQKINAAQLQNQQYQATLDAYINDMSTLILTYHLTDPKSTASDRAIAIAQTLTALRNLDGGRKGTLVRFLWESHLIKEPKPILNLYHADLNSTVFTNANLYQVYLSKLGLTNADFAGADLRGADLAGSVLIQASLQHANLGCYARNVCASLTGAYLMRADLADANLTGANLSGAYLDGANLSHATLAGAKLTKATYNTRPILVTNAQGKLVTDMPTRWPAGFSPAAAGATCQYC